MASLTDLPVQLSTYRKVEDQRDHLGNCHNGPASEEVEHYSFESVIRSTIPLSSVLELNNEGREDTHLL